jgi:hypothetical protein
VSGGGEGGEEGGGAPPAPAAVCDADNAAWWPLCMPSRAWLLALDAALLEPFLRREAGGSPRIADVDAAFAAEILGTGAAAALADATPGGDTTDDGDPPARRKGGGRKAVVGGGGGGGGGGGPRVFAGFAFWKDVYDKHAARSPWKKVVAGALWTEFCTHIKGSRRALESGDGRLTRGEYLRLPERATALADRDREAAHDAFDANEKARKAAGRIGTPGCQIGYVDLH